MRRLLSKLNISLAALSLLILAAGIQVIPFTECSRFSNHQSPMCVSENVTDEGFPHPYRTKLIETENDGGLDMSGNIKTADFPPPEITTNSNELKADIRFSACLFFIPLIFLLLVRQYAYSRD